MSPEEKELLRRSIVLSEENNDILRSIQRSMRLSRFLKLVYWVVVIGVAVGAFYFLKPYINSVMDLYNGAKTQLDQINSGVNGVVNKVKTIGQ